MWQIAEVEELWVTCHDQQADEPARALCVVKLSCARLLNEPIRYINAERVTIRLGTRCETTETTKGMDGFLPQR